MADLWYTESGFRTKDNEAEPEKTDYMIKSQCPVKLIIFDLDGTTADTLNGITAAINRALTACGLPTHSREGVRRFVNYGTRQFVLEAVPEAGRGDNVLLSRVTELYLEAYGDTYTMTEVYPGLPELLAKLQSRTLLAMNSNKQDEFVGKLAEQLYAPGTFIAAEGFRSDRPGKPDPAAALDILQKAEVIYGKPVAPGDCVYIGDSDIDYMTACNAGMRPLSVSWGYRPYEFLRELGEQPIAATPEELSHILSEMGI